MTCTSPFQMIADIGCIWLFAQPKHSYEEGKSECQSKGSDLFEFTNFDQQQQKVFDFLLLNGGQSNKIN